MHSEGSSHFETQGTGEDLTSTSSYKFLIIHKVNEVILSD